MASAISRFRSWLRRVLDDRDEAHGRPFARFISLLIVASVGLIGAEFAWPPDKPLPPILHLIDRAILAVFALEYLARLWVIDPALPDSVSIGRRERFFYHLAARVSWALRPLNLVDLVALLPLLPFLRSLRVLRVLRLFTRVDFARRLFRYFDPFTAASQILRANRLVFLFIWTFVTLAVFLGAAMGYVAEHRVNPSFDTPFDALWWATVTITTVGYGDVAPITTGGRLTAMALMFSGFFLFATVAGVVSQTFVHSLLHIREEGLRMSAMVNQIVVCGWNRYTPMVLQVVREQSEALAARVVVFADRDEPAELPEWATFVRGDPTQEVELSKVRLSVADAVVVVAEERPGFSFSDADARTLLTVFTVRSFERKLAAQGISRTRPIHVTAEMLDPDNLSFFENAGADEVIQTALQSASLLAKAAAQPQSGELMNELVCAQSSFVVERPLPEGVSLPAGFGALAAEIKRASDELPVGLVRAGRSWFNPPSATPVEPDDRLLFLTGSASPAEHGEEGASFWGPIGKADDPVLGTKKAS